MLLYGSREICRTHSDLALQHRHNLAHHSNQVFIFVCVVSEPNSFTYGQDFLTDITEDNRTKNFKINKTFSIL